MRTIKLYAVVKKKNPRLQYLELYQDTDIKIQKDEDIYEVEVKAIRILKKKPKKCYNRKQRSPSNTGHTSSKAKSRAQRQDRR